MKKELVCYFDIEAAGNPFFKEIYDEIFFWLKVYYPEYNFIHKQPLSNNGDWCMSCPGGRSNFQIINPKTNDSILMSFWDRGMDVFEKELGWNKYNIKQYFGGLGMFKTSKQIKEEYGTDHIPFQYPLGVKDSDKFIEEFREPYDPKKKIRKAIFIGFKHGTRTEMFEYMKDHPLIELYDNSEGYGGREFFKKVSQYALSLCFNGTGEFTLRDFESMGMGIPVIRSEMQTQFHNPLVPNYHYIKGSQVCEQAGNTYRPVGAKAIAEEYIAKIEEVINDDKKLKYISANGLQYYNNYCNPYYIVNLFMGKVNLKSII